MENPSRIATALFGRPLFVALILIGLGIQVAQAQVVTEFGAGMTAGANPTGITAGPDGNLWFTEYAGGRIGRITPSGVITEFDLGSLTYPHTITTGPDGNVWFVEFGYSGTNQKIGRITPAGAIAEFNFCCQGSNGITAGPDGNLWFGNGGVFQSMTPIGVVTSYGPIPFGGSGIGCMTAGSDGNLWSTAAGSGYQSLITRITPSGVITPFFSSFSIAGGYPCIAAGPDGNIWVAENYGVDRIGRITPTGVFTDFSVGITPGAAPGGVTAGPDGNVWFTEPGVNKVARITTDGVVTEFGDGITPGASPRGITGGPDGNIWFTEPGVDKIGRITTRLGPVTPTIDAPSLAPAPLVGPTLLPPPLPGSGCVPGNRKLVLVTHGWQPTESPPVAITDQPTYNISTSIRNKIDSNLARDACNWDVVFLDWTARAQTAFPQVAFASADEVASQVYDALQGKYRHVHLIAHSAGSQVVDALARRFKQEGSPPTVQETLLDAYNPLGNVNVYGCQANWAESYVDMRPAVPASLLLVQPFDLGDENLTLSGALNVDVTQLGDATWPPANLGSVFNTLDVLADHESPVHWYAGTIAAAPQPYGWSLSLEAGRSTLPNYAVGAAQGGRVCLSNSGGTYSCPAILTGPLALPVSVCTSSFVSLGSAIWDWVGSTVNSTTGNVLIDFSKRVIVLTTGSPAWLKMNVNLPQAVDTLKFDVQSFSAPGANGYLTVFVDGQLVSAREEAHLSGGQTTSVSIPVGALAAGTHWFGFRLDPTNAVQSQIQISNIRIGATTLAPDTAPPVITPLVTGTMGDNGWYRSNVSVNWHVKDDETVVGSTEGCGAGAVTTDTSGVTFTCSATSAGGRISKSITIKRDATQPIVVVLSPLASSLLSYKRNQAISAIYGCLDLRSGINQCVGTVALGARINTSSAGTKTFTVNARDKAGNVVTQTVNYAVK